MSQFNLQQVLKYPWEKLNQSTLSWNVVQAKLWVAIKLLHTCTTPKKLVWNGKYLLLDVIN